MSVIINDPTKNERRNQIKTDESKAKSGIKIPKILTGARKTMPSARKSFSKPGMMQTRIIRQFMPRIRTESGHGPSKINENHSLLATPLNPIFVNTSGMNFTSSSNPDNAADDGVKQAEKENFLNLICEQDSNRLLQDETGYRINDYREKPAEYENMPSIASQYQYLNMSPQKCEQRDKSNCDQRKCQDNNPSAEIFQNSASNLPTDTFRAKKPVILPVQRNVHVENLANLKKLDEKLYGNFHYLEGTNKKHVKTVRFSDNENQHLQQVNETQLPYRYTVQNFVPRQVPRNLIKHDKENNYQKFECRSNPSKIISDNTVNSNIGKNKLFGTNLRNMTPKKSKCFRMPPAYKKINSAFHLSRYSFPAHSPQKRMMGTATRNMNQKLENIRIVVPKPLHYERIVENHVRNPTRVSRPPFLVARIGAKSLGKRNPLKASNSDESANVYENNRKQVIFHNQPCTRNKHADLKNTYNIENTNFQTIPALREATNNVACSSKVANQINSTEESKGEDKIQKTKMMLSEISDLLQNINKELAGGFECPGLEPSLPIWKAELEQCILSVDKIKSAISDCEVQQK